MNAREVREMRRGRDPSKIDGCREAPVGRPELASCWLKLPGRALFQFDFEGNLLQYLLETAT